ncbi:MAG: dTMP kinase [Treponema sp.]|jgi:dTMP kinase|nr:dTMP kinase [Treponema sp.]
MTETIRNFVVFEGGDGSGTTTQLSLLERRFRGNAMGLVFHPTCEPTDGPVGALIRSVLEKKIALHPLALARLFAADRAEHLYGPGGIIERSGRGELVVSDRYVLSSLVYQGIECGDELPRTLNAPFPAPELLLFFDLDPQTACERLKNRPALELYEHLEFQQKVREKYLSLIGEYQKSGGRVEIIDASKSQEEAAAEVWRVILKMPILKTGR